MFATAAPGKVILFGEHAVVHGVPAIAASVALHTYVFVEESADPQFVELDFPEVSLVKKWRVSDLPWNIVKNADLARKTLDTNVLGELDRFLEDTKNPFERKAASTFLYLYLHICSKELKGLKFVTRSTLPIGAGLGSSASFSVALSAALLYAAGAVTVPTSRNPSDLKLIDEWSFMGESCIHGNPSGIDNIVASGGGAVLFQRQCSGPPKIEPFPKFPALGLILTNTGVPRETSQLVANVGALKTSHSSIVDPLFEAIRAIVNKADALIRADLSPEELGAELQPLVQGNHGILTALSVSHPSLERVRAAALENGIGQTKLTGAGGGGCAITIKYSECTAEQTQAFVSALEAGAKAFETELGGPGVGLILDVDIDHQKITAESDANSESRRELEKLQNWRYW